MNNRFCKVNKKNKNAMQLNKTMMAFFMFQISDFFNKTREGEMGEEGRWRGKGGVVPQVQMAEYIQYM